MQEPQQPVLVLGLYRSRRSLSRLIRRIGIPVVLALSRCYACGTGVQRSAHLVAMIFSGYAGCIVIKIIA